MLSNNERELLQAISQRNGFADVRRALDELERESLSNWQSLPDVKLTIIRKGDAANEDNRRN